MDPNGAFWLFAADSFREGTGDLSALRIDSKFDFSDESWFKAVRFGLRLSEREQDNKEIGLNWGGIAPAWAGGYGVLSQFDSPAHELVDFSNFFRGGVVQGTNTSFPYIRSDLLMDYGAFRNYIDNEPDLAGQPSLDAPRQPRCNGPVSSGGYFGHQGAQRKRLSAPGLRLAIWRDGMSLDGNIGVRFVKTTLESAGAFSYLPFNADPQTDSTPDGAAYSGCRKPR